MTDGVKPEAYGSSQAHVIGAFKPSDPFTAATALESVAIRSECSLGRRPGWQCAGAKFFERLLDPSAWHRARTVRQISVSNDRSIGTCRPARPRIGTIRSFALRASPRDEITGGVAEDARYRAPHGAVLYRPHGASSSDT